MLPESAVWKGETLAGLDGSTTRKGSGMTSVSLSSSTYSLHEPVQAKEQAGITTTNINDWMPVAPISMAV